MSKQKKVVKRIRGTELQRTRKHHLSLNPLCVMCALTNITTVAQELDHIVPLFKGGTNADGNLQGLCKECHAVKTAQDLGYSYKPAQTIGIDGWPVTISRNKQRV